MLKTAGLNWTKVGLKALGPDLCGGPAEEFELD